MKPFHLLILFVLNSTLKQANGQWVTGGPYIQNVNCIAFSGNNIFVGTDGSAVNGEGPVYLSSDNCRSWTSVSNGLPPEIASSIVVADSGIFAALPLYGVYFSNNNGTSWTLLKSGLTDLNISCLALSGTNLFAGTNSGVFLSTNNGTSWAPVRNGLTDTLVSSLVISGSDIYAGTSNGGAFLSSNNGGNWVAINNGALPGNAHIYSLAASGSSIYAAANSIYVTKNNGGSWTKLNGGPPVPATSVLVVDSTIYVGTYTQGIYVSTNNGASWAAANNGINGVYVKTFGYNGSEVLASVASNVYNHQPGQQLDRPY